MFVSFRLLLGERDAKDFVILMYNILPTKLVDTLDINYQIDLPCL